MIYNYLIMKQKLEDIDLWKTISDKVEFVSNSKW